MAHSLTIRGWRTVTCAVATPVRTAQDVLDAFLGELPAEQDVVLVPHSNAGAYVPELVMQRRVVAVVFVDAVVPPDRGHVPLAPPAFLDLLRAKADDAGQLPVWTAWWDPDDVADLFSRRPQTRAIVEQELRQLPVSYFEGVLPVPPGWDELPAAYLAFGDTYASERDEAARRHWPVTTLPGGHLQQLIGPDQVAAELVALFRRLDINMHKT